MASFAFKCFFFPFAMIAENSKIAAFQSKVTITVSSLIIMIHCKDPKRATDSKLYSGQCYSRCTADATIDARSFLLRLYLDRNKPTRISQILTHGCKNSRCSLLTCSKKAIQSRSICISSTIALILSSA